ncbi:MAG: patatin-like phospholipase family protein [Panacagrimonas sp.]
MDFDSILSRSLLFGGLPDPVLRSLASLAERSFLHSGEQLFAEGDPATAFFVVASGRLRVTSKGALLGYVGRLDSVGEIGVIRMEPRASSAHAVRDSVLLRFRGAPFMEFLAGHPAALLAITRMIIGRLQSYHGQRRQAATETEGNFTIVPASPNVPVMVLAEALVERLGGWPAARLVGAAHVDAEFGEGAAQTPLAASAEDGRLRDWLGELEDGHRYLVHAAHSDRDGWMRRCLRRADRVLVLAEANRPPSDAPILRELRESSVLARVELILLCPEGDPSPHTLEWLTQSGACAHYFLHPWDPEGLSALARQVTGRGVGLVLGGGGARGFAHIGLVRALDQLKIPVDATGGTSMGAFVAALLACGFDSVEMTHIARETFVARNNLNDYIVPKVALIRARKFLARLREIFGERRIEELRRSFYCISTNLTTGATGVHDRGLVAHWVGTSMAVPGIAPPIAFQGELLCDGGVVDNLPTDVMQGLERGSIIASDVSTAGDLRAPGAGMSGEPDPMALLNWTGLGRAPRLAEILMRTATLTSGTSLMRASAERADVYIRMPIQDIRMFDWHRLDDLVERGYEHAMKELTPLCEALVR